MNETYGCKARIRAFTATIRHFLVFLCGVVSVSMNVQTGYPK